MDALRAKADLGKPALNNAGQPMYWRPFMHELVLIGADKQASYPAKTMASSAGSLSPSTRPTWFAALAH